jgi:MoaA/NifB/PqqE/SkfB family radical SAM enzyme
MIFGMCGRMLANHDARLLAKFVHLFGWKGMRAVNRFKRRLDRGETFPAFLFLSVTNACNLRCQGCWVTPTDPVKHMSPELCNHIIEAGRRRGCYFYGLLGGEPLMHPNLIDIIAAHPDCYFQVFTNGTLINDEIAREFRTLGNVTPLISIEGSETVSDERRGGKAVYSRTLEGLERCREQRLITGVACSICQSNIEDLVSDRFVKLVMGRGVAYLWYYVYRPVGPCPAPELALTQEQVVRLRRFMVEARCRYPMAIVDA